MDEQTASYIGYVQQWTTAIEARKYEEALAILQEGLQFADKIGNDQIARHLSELARLTEGWLTLTNDQANQKEISREYEANLACSFCGKKRSQITTLIAGPRVHICSECVKRYASQRIDHETVAPVDKRS